ARRRTGEISRQRVRSVMPAEKTLVETGLAPSQTAEQLWVILALGRARLHRLRKNSIFLAILGGVALQTCHHCTVLNAALAAEGEALAQKRLFPQHVQPCRPDPLMKPA